MNLKEYNQDPCPCCGQTTTYLSKVNKGMVKMLIQIARFLGTKSINIFHPEKELVAQGYFTGSQRANMIHLRAHGLVAKVKHSPGNWCMTRKGADFLRGQEIFQCAIRSKTPPKSTVGYIDDMMCTINSVLKDDSAYWEGMNYQISEGRIIKENTNLFGEVVYGRD